MIGELIAQARKAAGLTQKQLGEMIGYKGPNADIMIQRFEANKREVPLSKVRALSKALNIPLENLIP